MSPVDFGAGPLPGLVLFWALFLAGLALFLRRGVKLLRLLRLGRPVHRHDQPAKRLRMMLADVLLQGCNFRRLSRRDLAGLGHALIFWGFGLYFVDYVVSIFIGVGFAIDVEANPVYAAFRWVLSAFGLLVLGSLIWAGWRRYVVRPARLTRSFEAAFILSAIFLLIAANFALAALQRESAAYRALWWAHYVAILAFGVYLLYSKHLHLVAAPFNLLFRPWRRVGEVAPVDPLGPLPASEVGFLHWKQLLDLYACAQCGRCQDACPAFQGGTALNPREMMATLKYFVVANGDGLARAKEAPRQNVAGSAIWGTIPDAALWACTSCGRCQEECPEVVEHADRIVGLRRSLVETGLVPTTARKCLESLALLGNPGEQPPFERGNWLAGLPAPQVNRDRVEVLYWVGCTGAFEPKGQEITRAMVDLLNASGMRYAILGGAERCCGDPARRLGDEGLFQRLARENIATLRRYDFDRVVTHCPHCFEVLRNGYGEPGGRFAVQHHTELLSDLAQAGRLAFQGFGERVAYHDPCYLGRYNGVYDAPRSLLGAVPKLALKEMATNRARANCCGGGGGQLWLEWSGGERINYARFAEAEATGPDVVATACPWCKVMLDDACGYREATGRIRVRDVAEVLQSALVRPSAAETGGAKR